MTDQSVLAHIVGADNAGDGRDDGYDDLEDETQILLVVFFHGFLFFEVSNVFVLRQCKDSASTIAGDDVVVNPPS